jgi:hypothetical protein
MEAVKKFKNGAPFLLEKETKLYIGYYQPVRYYSWG